MHVRSAIAGRFFGCCLVGAGEFAYCGVEVFHEGADDGVDDPDVDPGADDRSGCESDACGEEAVGS